MLSQIKLPTVRQDTTSATFVPIDGARVSFNVIEKAAIVELGLDAVYQHAAAGAPTGQFDLPAVQAQRVTAFALTNVAGLNDVLLDQTDVETDTSVIEHDNANTDQILIKETGLYLLTYMVGHDPSGLSTYAFQFTLNNTTLIAGSRITHTISSQETDLSAEVLAELTAGDYITLQADSGGATGSEIEHVSVTATRLRGSSVASSGAAVNLSFEINGEDVAAPYTDGLLSHSADASGQRVDLVHRAILEPGFYTVQAIWKTNNATGTGASLRADVWPANLTIEVRSNTGTLAHGVDAKPQGVF
jgi:hypothetical protein